MVDPERLGSATFTGEDPTRRCCLKPAHFARHARFG
jgi:hypothetical protein